jgi:hypothetical protein
MRCSKCGSDNRETRKFCVQCGAPLAANCSRCRASTEPGDRFCGDCGASLVIAQPAAVNRPRQLHPRMRFGSHRSRPMLRSRANARPSRRLHPALEIDAWSIDDADGSLHLFAAIWDGGAKYPSSIALTGARRVRITRVGTPLWRWPMSCRPRCPPRRKSRGLRAAAWHRFVLTRWWSKMDSNRRFRLLDRKRPLPAGFGSLSAPLGAAEADRRRTGF